MLLPPRNGRSSVQRLFALAGKAMADGQRNLRPKLRADEREELEAQLLLVGVRCVGIYDETLDRGTGSVPLEVRFGRFAYLRMRLAVVDWLRENRGYSRAGRARPPVEVSVNGFLDGRKTTDGAFASADTDPFLEDADLQERIVSSHAVARWRRAAEKMGMSSTEWLVELANVQADIVLMEEEVWAA